jgi:D-beta-D-heptose 7-phosphate kinase/D-beta-D-heptose 1-phosphate adenosyltransferase
MKEIINKFLSATEKKKIAICGDSMYDEYYEVDAERISPEFPIPVMMSSNSEPTKVMPGGAANVANQFKYFQHRFPSKLYTFVDKDFWKLLSINRIDSHQSPLTPFTLPKKKRLYCNGFPLCRWDIEDDTLRTVVSKDKVEFLQEALYDSNPDIVIFSDYDKGTFTYSDSWIKKSDAFTIVDPKAGDLSRWNGCDLFKPNRKEAIELSEGETNWKKQCVYFLKNLKCKSVVITCGEDGVFGATLRDPDGFFEYTPKDHIDAESVIGAGDCFVSFLAMGIGAGLSIRESSTLAYEAGKIYVQKKYNEPVTPMEIYSILKDKHIEDISLFKARNYTLSFANGVFDILHRGHIELLQMAKDKSDKLVVALNSDESVVRLKGPNRPINCLEDRIAALKALECVDYVTVIHEDTPIKLIKEIVPDLIIKGGDYKKEDVIGNDICNVEIFPLYKDLSTTKYLDASKRSGKQA